jgi:uncharacterized membrane protein YcaP (DUF421 family)
MTAETLLGIGVEPRNYTVLQVCMRTLIIFFASLIMIRIADRRFLAQKTGFDAVVALVLASTLSRAINGSAGLAPTIIGALIIILLHRLLAKLAFHSLIVCRTLKGDSDPVIVNGQVIEKNLAKYDLTVDDLREDIRLQGHPEDFTKVREARIERSGEISIVPKEND